MYYSLCVATDFLGRKLNFQFYFDSHGPQLAQILSRATEAFNKYFQTHGVVERPFSITTAVIFNENTETWDRLERSAQLVHNGQIYLFQPDVTDIPAEIPDPVSAAPYLSDYVSPQRSYSYGHSYTAGSSSQPRPLTYGERRDLRAASPGAQIPASYDPYVRQRYHEVSPQYQPRYEADYQSPRPANGAGRRYDDDSSSAHYTYYAGASSYNSRAGSVGGGGIGAPSSSSVVGYREPSPVAKYPAIYTSTAAASSSSSPYASSAAAFPRGEVYTSSYPRETYSGRAPVPLREQQRTTTSSYTYANNSNAQLAEPSFMSRADLESNPDYVALMRRAASSQPRRSTGGADGPSIFAEERRYDADLSRLPLDQYRDVVRSEAREFTPSPSRERSRN